MLTLLYSLPPATNFFFRSDPLGYLWLAGVVGLGIVWARGMLCSGSDGLCFSSSKYSSSAPSCSSQLLARQLERIDFPFSKWSLKEIKFFHLVLAVLLKFFSNGVHPIEACFEILKFQIIFSIEEFRAGFGNSKDIASNLDFIV